ncbi:alcohol-forming fatty acyl-CoA reductase-like [Olea europaea var. sylvestris]|uniref:alcohol-forming fatty acyl-CoA reductase-like n=1 Tax=Olea europaea var. sylvestris TaxID=158386 RepID=UPI000C1D56F7|nr:alcohol-forming fatty acyl-CoA reductase-like [Olea europaea var. sylvestris]
MEFSSILPFLKNRTILITGATGFLAKIYIEKILRVQPNVKKLYLLLRAGDTKSALSRFNNEVISKDLFGVLKDQRGANFTSFISDKITIVPGDVTCENLGINDLNLSHEIFTEVDVVINLAATTKFDERYDVALGINTLGPMHVLNFAKTCGKLKVLLHVSTAYVCGEREGVILEKPFNLGDTLNGTSGLDINAEKQLIEERLKELNAENVSAKSITSAMKDLGIQRARKYGWPNTYAFTKAMGEMLIGIFKQNIPLVIIRPTIITSTYKEPFPGWLEGVRNIDSFVVGYGKGRIKCIPGDPHSIVDLIPADMVVNAMIAATVAHADEPDTHIIYHVGSSMANPVSYSSLQDFGLHYFTKNPWNGEDGKPTIVVKAMQLSSMAIFQRYMKIRYLIPLKVLYIVNAILCQYFGDIYRNLRRKVMFLMRLVELFSPYIFFKGM